MDARSKLMSIVLKQESIVIEGTTFIVKEMYSGDKSTYEATLYKYKQVGKEVRVEPNTLEKDSRMILYTLHDEKGERVFKDEADLVLIDKLPSSVTKQIVAVADRLNGLSQGEVTKN